MDVQMPVMDGPAATRAIRDAEAAQRPAAHADHRPDRQRHGPPGRPNTCECGMDAIVAKPIELAELIAGIEAVLTAAEAPSTDVEANEAAA